MSCASCGHENPAGARFCNGRLGACDVGLARVRLLASEPVPDRTAIESALESVDALAAELGAASYRRLAEFERARLAQTVSVTPR